MADLLVVGLLATVWWVPTFMALTDLQRRDLPRLQVWRWTALLCVPVVGALLYFRRFASA